MIKRPRRTRFLIFNVDIATENHKDLGVSIFPSHTPENKKTSIIKILNQK